jgi:hypothetical protein
MINPQKGLQQKCLTLIVMPIPSTLLKLAFRSLINLDELRHKKTRINGISHQGHDHGISSVIVSQEGL